MFDFKNEIAKEISNIKEQNLYKQERLINGTQGAEILVNDKKLLNFCANNYLGLANDPEVLKATKESLDKWGYGLSSVRFICGTQDIHKELEKKVSDFYHQLGRIF